MHCSGLNWCGLDAMPHGRTLLVGSCNHQYGLVRTGYIYTCRFSINLKLAHSNSSSNPLNHTRSSQQSIACHAFDRLHILCHRGGGHSDRLRQGLGLTSLYGSLPIPFTYSSDQGAEEVSVVSNPLFKISCADLFQGESHLTMARQLITTRLISRSSSNR